jgi:hypothetical protein
MFLQLHGCGVVPFTVLHYFGAQALRNADGISTNIVPTATGENDTANLANLAIKHYAPRIRDQSRNI